MVHALLTCYLSVLYHHVGISKYYSPTLMTQVAHNRGLPVEPHMASRPDCSTLGSHFHAVVNGHAFQFEQVDCSAPVDLPRHLREGLVLEVDYSTAAESGFNGLAIVYGGTSR